MLAHSYLIESSSKLLVTRTGIKAQSSLNLGRIRPLILELLALEWRKFHTFELEYLWSQLANFDQILCVASLGWGKGCIRFWARLTLAHWTQVSDRCPLGYLFSFVVLINLLYSDLKTVVLYTWWTIPFLCKFTKFIWEIIFLNHDFLVLEDRLQNINSWPRSRSELTFASAQQHHALISDKSR